MPTFARLVGALLLAAVGGYVAMLTRAYLPEGTPGKMLIPVAVGMGVLIGWRFTGRHLDRGAGSPLTIGLSSAVLLAFWVALLFAIEEMIGRAMNNVYRGSPTEALQDMFAIFVGYGSDYLQLDVILALLVGGVGTGVLTWVAGRFFR